MRQTKAAAARATLLVNIGQLLTLRGGAGPRRGKEMSELGVIEDGAVLVGAGKIVAVGKTRELLRHAWVKKNRKNLKEVDCGGSVVLPGFVDAHTHPVFVTPRLVDFEKRITGASYEEIAEAGGGIRSSLAGVRSATRKTLAEHVLAAFERMAEQGTTTVEAKSGYGLSVEAELKSLEAIREAARHWPGTVVATLLGAHVPPPEFEGKADGYVEAVAREMIPQAARRGLARFVDVFCDRGAFTLPQSERLFEAAVDHRMGTRAHVCQLTPLKLETLLRYKPASLDHLDYVSEEDVSRLAMTDTVATLVPGANYFLRTEQFPPARKLIEAGVPVALATDYNPGTSPTVSMPFVLSLACTQMKMSPGEALAAATINGAHSLMLEGSKGSVEAGKHADLAVFDVKDFREICYWFASNYCIGTMLGGEMRGSLGATG